jgi:hypothetical protein
MPDADHSHNGWPPEPVQRAMTWPDRAKADDLDAETGPMPSGADVDAG